MDKRYVPDASVIIKWVLGDKQEPDQEKAQELLEAWAGGRIEIVAPDLWQYEVGNFLGRTLYEEAQAHMELLLGLGITSAKLTPSIFGRCFKWMKTKGVTFYDASYLSVAVESSGILVTADEKFARRMENEGNICILKNLKVL